MLAAIDIGNSRLKWALFDGTALRGAGAVTTVADCLEALAAEADAPSAVALAPTGSPEHAQALLSGAGERWPGVPRFVARTRARCAGLVNAYQDPATMGVDRWLAMVEAWSTVRLPVCVVDAGTAVTVDAVDGAGQQLGGLIIPGQALMMGSLARSTARVGAHAATDAVPRWGRSTGACVEAGSVAAIRGAVREAVAGFRADFQDGRVFLTGGDRGLLHGAVHAGDDSVTIDPVLVLRGLERCWRLGQLDAAGGTP
ncbi:MAG: type III pantothenate kinase [Pseudomonadota bacterium]